MPLEHKKNTLSCQKTGKLNVWHFIFLVGYYMFINVKGFDWSLSANGITTGYD